ncbi:MAG TPA: hypothetical protein VFS87_05920 [Qipengyuania sp.]|nr:hypothetical protein [Qipengyuania sp.]
MSRSKHQTYSSVFAGKSKREIDAMFAEGDEDAMELLKKRQLKSQAKAERKSD